MPGPTNTHHSDFNHTVSYEGRPAKLGDKIDVRIKKLRIGSFPEVGNPNLGGRGEVIVKVTVSTADPEGGVPKKWVLVTAPTDPPVKPATFYKPLQGAWVVTDIKLHKFLSIDVELVEVDNPAQIAEAVQTLGGVLGAAGSFIPVAGPAVGAVTPAVGGAIAALLKLIRKNRTFFSGSVSRSFGTRSVPMLGTLTLASRHKKKPTKIHGSSCELDIRAS